MHLMVDIETMSLSVDRALVLSVAAVPFVPDRRDGPFIGDSRIWILDPREQFALGREVSLSTSQWWAQQKPEARAHWTDGIPTSLDAFLQAFVELVTESAGDGIWAHGIAFDLCNIETLYTQSGKRAPWKYNAASDARTVYRHCPQERYRPAEACNVIKHDPISDCKAQIWNLWERWPALPPPPEKHPSAAPLTIKVV